MSVLVTLFAILVAVGILTIASLAIHVAISTKLFEQNDDGSLRHRHANHQNLRMKIENYPRRVSKIFIGLVVCSIVLWLIQTDPAGNLDLGFLTLNLSYDQQARHELFIFFVPFLLFAYLAYVTFVLLRTFRVCRRYFRSALYLD